MEQAYTIAAEKSGQSMQRGREAYNRKANTSILEAGDRVLVKRLLERGGPGKLRSFWEDKIYIVIRRIEPTGAVYEVQQEDGSGRKRILHRNLLLPCHYLPSETDRNVQLQPRRQRSAPTVATRQKTVSNADYEVDSTALQEDDHAIFSRRQVDGIIRHLNETSEVNNSKEEKLLGILIDANLSFEKHISNICQKAGIKLFALSRMSAYLGTDKLRLLMRAFVTSQFQYCPLVWMFHSRKMNNKINRLHERALRIAYKDFCSSFATLLEKDRSVTIHEKNLQLLMTEMFKAINNQSPTFMNEIFPQRNAAYNLRNSNTFTVPIVHTAKYGTETVRYRGQRIWYTLSQEIKDANSVQQFKNRIKFWKCVDCDCRLCRQYIPELGFS